VLAELGLSGLGAFCAVEVVPGAASAWAITSCASGATACAAVAGEGSGCREAASDVRPRPDGIAAAALDGTAAAACTGTAAAGLWGIAAVAAAGTALSAVGTADGSGTATAPRARAGLSPSATETTIVEISASMPTSPRSFGNLERAISNFLVG